MTGKKTEPSSELAVVAQPGELAASTQSQAQALAFAPTDENINLLKQSLADSKTVLTDSELGIFLYQAQKTGLDPLARQIYVLKRKGGGVSFMTSIDGQRLVAQRTHEYDGQTPPEWCGQDGVWKEVWLSEDDPAASRVGVYRKGMREPVYGVATWKSYAQYKDEWVNGQKTNGRVLSGVWGQMGDVMLAKCAEALALRKAFPQELSGLYTSEEINSAEGQEPPRTLTTKDALAEAGKALTEKGFTRDEALLIMAGIADVDDPSKLTGQRLGPILEIVHREDADSLSLYLPGNPDDDAEDAAAGEPQEAEVVDPPAQPEKPAAKPVEPKESPKLSSNQGSMLIGLVKRYTGLENRSKIIDYIVEQTGHPYSETTEADRDAIKKKLGQAKTEATA